MPRIALLPEHVASQVAAGEVVERPASVVKELVENSLDAGSTRIEVSIRRGGSGSLRVVDDGFGMDRDDALLCLERTPPAKSAQAQISPRSRRSAFVVKPCRALPASRGFASPPGNAVRSSAPRCW
jgi:DNA mismatch repair protein MutL